MTSLDWDCENRPHFVGYSHQIHKRTKRVVTAMSDRAFFLFACVEILGLPILTFPWETASGPRALVRFSSESVALILIALIFCLALAPLSGNASALVVVTICLLPILCSPTRWAEGS